MKEKGFYIFTTTKTFEIHFSRPPEIIKREEVKFGDPERLGTETERLIVNKELAPSSNSTHYAY